jgi:hypothetical protein
LHSNRKGRPSLVCDLIEPLRPVMDRAVLALVNAHTPRVGGWDLILPDGLEWPSLLLEQVWNKTGLHSPRTTSFKLRCPSGLNTKLEELL